MITAGVMHMGELKFKQQGREEQAQPDAPDVINKFQINSQVNELINQYNN